MRDVFQLEALDTHWREERVVSKGCCSAQGLPGEQIWGRRSSPCLRRGRKRSRSAVGYSPSHIAIAKAVKEIWYRRMVPSYSPNSMELYVLSTPFKISQSKDRTLAPCVRPDSSPANLYSPPYACTVPGRPDVRQRHRLFPPPSSCRPLHHEMA